MLRRALDCCACLLLLVCAVGAGQAQQGDAPVLGLDYKKHPHRDWDATLHVTCDLACTWSLDRSPQSPLSPGQDAMLHIKKGSHLLEAKSSDGLDSAVQTFFAAEGAVLRKKMALSPARQARLDEEQKKLKQAAEDAARQALAEANKRAQAAQDAYDRKQYAVAAGPAQETCTAGSVVGCRVLGLLSYYGRSVPQDLGRARHLFESACEGRDLRACSALSNMDSFDLDLPHDYSRANALSSMTCSAGDMRGCIDQGLLLQFGKGVPKNGPQALAMFKKACDGGNMDGCAYEGWGIYTGLTDNPDIHAARSLLERSCGAESSTGCTWLGEMLESSLEYPAALADLHKACDWDGGGSACMELGLLSVFGKGTVRNLTQARDLFEHACKPSFNPGCLVLGESYAADAQPDMERALTSFRQSCEGGNDYGCFDLAMNRVLGSGTFQDATLARDHLQKACQDSDETACTELTALQARSTDTASIESEQLYTENCMAWNLLACESLVGMPEAPNRTYELIKDRARASQDALPVFQASCDGGNARGCAALGELYNSTVLASRDKKRAKAMFKQACMAGLQTACNRASRGH